MPLRPLPAPPRRWSRRTSRAATTCSSSRRSPRPTCCGRSAPPAVAGSALVAATRSPRRRRCAATVPFLLPYAALRAAADRARAWRVSPLLRRRLLVRHGVREQPSGAASSARSPKAEGDLFPGLVAAAPRHSLGVAAGDGDATRDSVRPPRDAAGLALLVRRWRRCIPGRGRHLALSPRRRSTSAVRVRITNVDQLLLRAAVGVAVAADVSPRLPQPLAGVHARRAASSRLALLVAVWLSLGVASGARTTVDLPAPIRLLYDHVPGFDGVRVPARFGMIGR